MREQIDAAIALLKQQDINGCITGSCLLDYFEGQDIDVFVYDESSFNKLLFFMHYNPMFTILDTLEKHKFDSYVDDKKSSLESLGLITIKFKYNLSVDVNVVYKKFNKTCFDVIANFDMDIIAVAHDIKTGRVLNLRETTGKVGTWNRWNKAFYKADMWSVKRLLRQFERVVKYTRRGYDLTTVTERYIELVEKILSMENVYKSEKGTKFFNDAIEQFEVVLKILKIWKETQTMSDEQILILKTLI